MRVSCVLLGMTIVHFLSTPPTLVGQQFRIESMVYAGDSNEVASENLTLFDGDKVYDFMLLPREPTKVSEIVIFDFSDQRFTLLDTLRRLKLELSQADLTQLLATMKSSESFSEDMRFLVQPAFKEEFDAVGNILELRSNQIMYRVKGEPIRDDNVWKAYGKFVDAYTQLNATDPRKLPPFAHMFLNQAIKAHRLMPTEVAMTLDMPDRSGLGNHRITATSKHSAMWSLSDQDRQKIEQAGKLAKQFSETTLGVFRRLETSQAADSSVQR